MQRSTPHRDAPAFHTLRQYAVLADGERGAVIGPDGAIVWLCFPRWDSGALFSSLIGGRGFYSVSPESQFVWGGYYEPGTLIWRSRWVTVTGIVECREALAVPSRVGRAVLLRRIIGVSGAADVRVQLEARADYGSLPASQPRLHHTDTWEMRSGPVHMRWSGADRAVSTTDGHGGHLLTTQVDVREGQTHDFVLELFDHRADAPIPSPVDLWSGTEAHWRETVPPLQVGHAERDARHAYAVLAGLTSTTGGMVAAATTSLPERAAVGRSYDYRYVWLRDQSYAGQAVAAAGGGRLLDDAVRFATDRVLADGRALQPAYTVTGDPIPSERALELTGYPGGSDVVGNHVNGQFQLDVFGEVLQLFASAARLDRLDVDGWRAVEIVADAIATGHDRPDAGIWELEDRRWTHSRLECVAGLRSISASPSTPRRHVGEWTALADALLAEVSASCIHHSGRWQRSPDDPGVDAALLLAAIRHAVPADDPRSVATHDAVRAELAQDGYLYRFRHDQQPLARAEGAFLLCGFWMAMSCAHQDEPVEAARWFERSRAACGSPGLYAEEFDVGERQLRGNLPQAFVHALLLECAATLPPSGQGSGHCSGDDV